MTHPVLYKFWCGVNSVLRRRVCSSELTLPVSLHHRNRSTNVASLLNAYLPRHRPSGLSQPILLHSGNQAPKHVFKVFPLLSTCSFHKVSRCRQDQAHRPKGQHSFNNFKVPQGSKSRRDNIEGKETKLRWANTLVSLLTNLHHQVNRKTTPKM